MRTIGQVFEIYGQGFPPISEMISDIQIQHKEEVLRFLRNGRVIAASPSILRDVITGEQILEELTTQVSGEYHWRSDVAYYFGKYNLKLPEDFIDYALTATY
ncbi:MAG: hypothetical protein VB099_20920 [Candidatus Limiplasma sp.]|nr:hypothetical protein [Candidatus Limiplasma sp.]